MTAPGATGAQRARLLGTVFVVLGAMLFATKGILAKDLYARGIGFEPLVAIRALVAVPFFWAFAAVRARQAPPAPARPQAIAAACLAGLICYYGGALLDFYALTMIDASVERVLMFSYPAFVVVFSALLTKRRPATRVLVACAMTYAGIYFAVGGFDHSVARANALGATLVILSALTFAVYFMIGERFLGELGSARFTLYAMGSAAVALGLHYVARHPLSDLARIDAASWWVLLALGTMVMFVPALLQAEGVKRIGAERAAIVSTAGPPTTIALAWFFLDERMTAWQFAGVALILGGIVVLDLARGKRRARSP